MKVLNLGSSGQIGAYLTEYLRKKGHEVIEFDRNRHHGEDLTQMPITLLSEQCKNVTSVSSLPLMWVDHDT